MVMRRSGVRSAFHIVSTKNPRKSHGRAMNEDYKTNDKTKEVIHQQCPASEASLIQTMRRNVCAAIVVHELSDREGDRAHADLWAAVDESFLQ